VSEWQKKGGVGGRDQKPIPLSPPTKDSTCSYLNTWILEKLDKFLQLVLVVVSRIVRFIPERPNVLEVLGLVTGVLQIKQPDDLKRAIVGDHDVGRTQVAEVQGKLVIVGLVNRPPVPGVVLCHPGRRNDGPVETSLVRLKQRLKPGEYDLSNKRIGSCLGHRLAGMAPLVLVLVDLDGYMAYGPR
jgi:hypothetical protein